MPIDVKSLLFSFLLEAKYDDYFVFRHSSIACVAILPAPIFYYYVVPSFDISSPFCFWHMDIANIVSFVLPTVVGPL